MATSSDAKRSSLPRLVYPAAAKKQLPSAKDAHTMNRVTSGISGVLETLQMKIDLLDREIRADESGKQDYDDQLFRLGERRRDLDSKLRQCRDWIATFESKIQPLEGKYDATTQLMQQQYEDAKLRHAQGIQVLIDEFDYHPEFKRYSDTFSAVPFRPK
ncbi:hypothetical protein PINS_up008278 [Pythium insidiosum]|nr:hypothetical protein PINS_up008278 [Pythium insidiosum]